MMKRIYLLCTVALALLLLGSCGQRQQQMSYIGAESAKQVALSDAGLTSDGVESLTADLTSRDNQDYYQVAFTAAGQSYTYDVDALSGVVIQAHAQSAAAETSAPASTDQTASEGTLLSAQDAQAKALAHAGLTDSQVTLLKCELGYEHRWQVYEVEFYAQDKGEYDYEIDAYTGQVVSFDYDAARTVTGSNGSAITADEAKELALAQVPGASASDIKEFKTDHDDGRTEYEGKILYNGMEYEFEIDGYSGAIRSWEAEPAGH